MRNRTIRYLYAMFLCTTALALSFAGPAAGAQTPILAELVGTEGGVVMDAANSTATTVIGSQFRLSLPGNSSVLTWYRQALSGGSLVTAGNDVAYNAAAAVDREGRYFATGVDDPLTLLVYPQIAVSPSFATGQAVTVGQSATFTANLLPDRGVPGHNNYVYRWQYKAPQDASWTPINANGEATYSDSGFTVNGNALTVSGAAVVNGRFFQVFVKDNAPDYGFFTVKSDVAALTVIDNPSFPGGGTGMDFRIMPSASGTTAEISVTFTAAGGRFASAYKAEWYFEAGGTPFATNAATGTHGSAGFRYAAEWATGGPVSTTGTATLKLGVPLNAAAAALHGKKFYCIIRDTDAPTAYVQTGNFTVKQVDVAMTHGNTASARTVSVGERLDPGICGGNGALSYQWYVLTNPAVAPASGQEVCSGNAVQGAGDATYTPSSSSYPTPGTYYFACAVSDSNVSLEGVSPVYSGVYKLTVTPPALAIGNMTLYWNDGTSDVRIDNNNAYAYVKTGTTVKFRAAVSNATGEVTWKLYRADNAAGLNASVLETIQNFNASVEFSRTVADSYYYYIEATCGGQTVSTGKIRQNSASVLGTPTVSYGTVVDEGNTLTLTASNWGGTGNETVRWYKKGETTQIGNGSVLELPAGTFDTGDWFEAEIVPLNATFGNNIRHNNSTAAITVKYQLRVAAGVSHISTGVRVENGAVTGVLDVLPEFSVTATGGESSGYTYAWTMSGPGIAARPVRGTPGNQSAYQIVIGDLEGLDFSGSVPLDAVFTCTVGDGTDTVAKDFHLYLFWSSGSSVVVVPENPGSTGNPLDREMYEGREAGIVMRPLSGTAPFSYMWKITYPDGTDYDITFSATGTAGGDYGSLPADSWAVTGSPSYPTLRALSGLPAGAYTIAYTITDNGGNSENYTGTWTVRSCPSHGSTPLHENNVALEPASIAQPVGPGYNNGAGAGYIRFTANDTGVAVPGETARHYQWQVSTNGGATWNNVGNDARVYDMPTAPYAGRNIIVRCCIEDVYHNGDSLVAADGQTAMPTTSAITILSGNSGGDPSDPGTGVPGDGTGNNPGGNGNPTWDTIQGVKLYFDVPEPYVAGGTATVSLLTTPAGAKVAATWSSSNTAVATVTPKAGSTGDGLVKFLKAGTTTITATVTHGGGSMQTSIEIIVHPSSANEGTFTIEFPDGFLEPDGTLLLMLGEQLNAQLFSAPAGASGYTASGLPRGLTLSSSGVLSGSISANSFCNPCTGSDGIRRQTFNTTISATKNGVTRTRTLTIALEDRTQYGSGSSSTDGSGGSGRHSNCDTFGAGYATLVLGLTALLKRRPR